MKKKSQKQLKQEQLILEETNNNLFQNEIEKVMEYIRSKKLYAFYYHKNEKIRVFPYNDEERSCIEITKHNAGFRVLRHKIGPSYVKELHIEEKIFEEPEDVIAYLEGFNYELSR